MGHVGKSEQLKTKDPLYALRHSAAHVMAQAVRRLYPQTKLASMCAYEEHELLGTTSYPVNRGGVKFQVEKHLEGCAFPVYLQY